MTAVRLSRLIPVAALVLLLAACTDDAPAEDEGGSASGEVLPGSISDAMIQSDSLQSQPPLMASETAAAGSAPTGAAEAGEDAVAEGEEAAAPAEEPEAAAE
ncbi:MAG TPA: hypothetical protein VLA45_10220 [Paracoccaceae bacterium]|nr:hypothetical protein [Paracoccaceae bacterium]